MAYQCLTLGDVIQIAESQGWSATALRAFEQSRKGASKDALLALDYVGPRMTAAARTTLYAVCRQVYGIPMAGVPTSVGFALRRDNLVAQQAGGGGDCLVRAPFRAPQWAPDGQCHSSTPMPGVLECGCHLGRCVSAPCIG